MQNITDKSVQELDESWPSVLMTEETFPVKWTAACNEAIKEIVKTNLDPNQLEDQQNDRLDDFNFCRNAIG